MSFTVTARQTGVTAAGTSIRLIVLTGAAASASQTGAIAGQHATAAQQVSITTTVTGSQVYGAMWTATTGTFTANGNTTMIDNVHEADGLIHGTCRTTTATGTPGAITIGASAPTTSGSIALAEILPNGTITQDASGPPFVYANTGVSATTAAFTPPNGSLLVAVAVSNGGAGVVTMQIVDTSGLGLNWIQLSAQNASSAAYAGVWVADFPVIGNPQPVGQPTGGPWTLAFDDEFTGIYDGKPNPAVWTDHFNNGDEQRTNNANELEWYPHGSYGNSVAGGVLSQTAVFQNPQTIDPHCPNPLQTGGSTGTFTSGIISSQPGFAATYGYWEARTQNTAVGTSPGTWPAFWMITRDVAYPPEIDIDEYNVPGHSGSVHSGYRNTAGTWTEVFTAGVDTSFHVWGMRLDSAHVTFFLDGAQLLQATYDGDAYAWTTYFDHAIGPAGTSTGFPASFNVDYFRMWVVSGVPAAPQITSISPASGIPSAGQVVVSFSTVAGATSYRVTPAPTDYLADGISRPSHSSFTGASSPITVTGLTNGAHYNFTVCGINATGYGIESQPIPVLAPPSGPILPGII